jgi:NADH-quinone oxidoreductase subunit N
MLSLGYYLRVVTAMWMRGAAAVPAGAPAAAAAFAPIAGGSPEADNESATPDADTDRAPDPHFGGALEKTPAQESESPGAARAPEPGRPERPPPPELAGIAVLFGAAIVFFGIFPSPLFSLATHAGQAISGLF